MRIIFVTTIQPQSIFKMIKSKIRWFPGKRGVRECTLIQPSRWVAILVPPKTDRPASLWAAGHGRNRVYGERFSHPDLLKPSAKHPPLPPEAMLFFWGESFWGGRKRTVVIFGSDDRQHRLLVSLVSFTDWKPSGQTDSGYPVESNKGYSRSMLSPQLKH